MPKQHNKRIYLIGGFLAIFLIYSLYNIFLLDVNYYNEIPRKIRHLNKFIVILLVYGIGTYTLKKYTANWMMQVWHLLYIIVIAFLLLIGAYDWIFGIISDQLRNIASTFLEFLISPIFYAAMAILNNRFFLSKEKDT